jgi:hypothetical protein
MKKLMFVFCFLSMIFPLLANETDGKTSKEFSLLDCPTIVPYQILSGAAYVPVNLRVAINGSGSGVILQWPTPMVPSVCSDLYLITKGKSRVAYSATYHFTDVWGFHNGETFCEAYYVVTLKKSGYPDNTQVVVVEITDIQK